MKTLVRNTALYAVALFLLPQLLTGVHVAGGFLTYLFGGFFLTLLHWLLKPVLTLVSLPLTIATMGLFSVVINAIILYLLTILVPNISISHFIFSGARFAGFVIPRMGVNTFFAFVLSGLLLSGIVNGIKWLAKA